jgi:queuine tRNA-ribosyltransferase
LLNFRVIAEDGAARRGVLTTDHGELETPGFFGVATQAALKGLDPDAARRAGVGALIANAYHLHLQPGGEAVARAGGLHRYMGWDGVLATDSGGFQVFSLQHGHVADEIKGRRRLPALQGGRPRAGSAEHGHGGNVPPAIEEGEPIPAVRVDEDGADFRSYLDGSRQRFTPESSMALQHDLGADLLMCLDECTPFHVPAEYTRAATERNLRWARRCAEEFERLGMGDRQSLYGINHGGVYPELRRLSAKTIGELPFAGMAIGDCLGRTKPDWYRVVELVVPLLPAERPRHLLGVGEPDDLVEGALRGVDSFDCAMPTRIARHGNALHLGRPRFRVNLGDAARAGEDGPVEEGCDCHTCARYGRAYLHHLFKAHEMLAISLTAEHNLRFTARLLERVREAISAGGLAELRREILTPAAESA